MLLYSLRGSGATCGGSANVWCEVSVGSVEGVVREVGVESVVDDL